MADGEKGEAHVNCTGPTEKWLLSVLARAEAVSRQLAIPATSAVFAQDTRNLLSICHKLHWTCAWVPQTIAGSSPGEWPSPSEGEQTREGGAVAVEETEVADHLGPSTGEMPEGPMTHSAIAEPAPVATGVAESRQLRSPPPALEAALEAEERSIATQRLAALGEMTRGIAHDFRNLLAAVLAGLRLAEKNAGDPDQVRVYLSATREALQRGTDLTSQLLAFARHQELDAHAGDANVFLRTFEPFLRYGAGPDMTLTLHLASNLPSCLIDPAFFHAAVLNLVTNARDAMSGGGRIEISTGLEAVGPPAAGTLVRVRVQDQGPGMPPDVLAQVFDPFFTTKGDKGTGIGLSQVRAFTRMVGGHVRIDSRPGAGTAVDMLFPAVAEGRPMRAENG